MTLLSLSKLLSAQWEDRAAYLRQRGRSGVPQSLKRAIGISTAALVFACCLTSSASAHWGSAVGFGGAQASLPVGVAVDESTGDAYLANLLSVGIDKFDASRALLTPPSPFGSGSGFYSGVAVDPTNGDVDVVDAAAQTIDVYDPTTGGLLSSFGVPGSGNFEGSTESLTVAQIATDAAGNIYMPNGLNHEIQVFSPSGGAPSGVVSTIVGTGEHALNEPTGVAVDTTGNIWVSDTGNGRLEEFESSGQFVKEIKIPGVGAVAVDRSGDVFASVEEGPTGPELQYNHLHEGLTGHITEYNAAGVQIDDFGRGIIGASAFVTPNSIAFDEARGVVYLADGGHNIAWAFVPSPEVSALSASNVQQTTVTLNGHVDPAGAGEVTSCEFEYGTTTAYGETAPCAPAPPYSGVTDVSAAIASLLPSTTYHYRLKASTAHGIERGNDETVTTRGLPGIAEEFVTAAATTATVRARIDPFGYDTTCEIQYVDDADFQSSGYAAAKTASCAGEGLGAGFAYHNVTTTLNGLRISTTYHLRTIASNQGGVTEGPERTFTTFGISSFSLGVVNDETQPYDQAGGHPYELTTSFTLNTTEGPPGAKPILTDANPKNVRTELPPGLIGNPRVTPQCASYNVAHASCSGDSQVGILTVTTTTFGAPEHTTSPIYNIIPPAGVAAQFAGRFNGYVTAHIDASVRTGGDYGVTGSALYVSAAEGVTGVSVTLWGVPADPSHDPERYCPPPNGPGPKEVAGCSSKATPKPFLTDPTSCSNGLLTSRLSLDSWQEPGAFAEASAQMPGMTACNRLDFSPKMEIKPESSSADSPTGVEVNLHVPQNENPVGLAEADLKDATVTLPAGVSINPSAGGGLAACSPAQIEMNGPAPAHCPDASKIGTVEINTPLLDHPIKGGVYVATQEQNPFGSLFALYIAVNDPKSGVVVKLAGKVSPDNTTGQLTTTFDNNPQLPFEDLKLVFSGGQRAALATPQTCGTFTSTSQLTPWSSPESGPPATSAMPFTIGSGCTGGFAPSFSAGTVNNKAGGFSSFTVTLSRKDGEQNIGGVSVTMPPGIAAILAKVPLCKEAEAQAGTCPAASRIGTTNAAAGAGSDPFWLSGPVYLTGPYNGAPFGLSVVVPAVAGPFNLGNVVVRAAIKVDPRTAQVTVTSDPLPHIKAGVPFRLKTVNVTVERPEFLFNPTNCSQFNVTGSITGALPDGSTGITTPVSTPFQSANCPSLKFAPKFSVSTLAKTSRVDGASLDVKLSYPSGSMGMESNIGAVKVELPKALPSRLTTLQKACTAKAFETDPASCPAESVIGHAVVHTEVLPVPLEGPAYFVSHGGEAFPQLIMVLQGDGVTFELVGDTLIKDGITSSTFPSTPDVPFETFELNLPQGPFSVLAATGNLCDQSLVLPVVLQGQNGAQVSESVPLTVTGCTPAITVVRRKVKGRMATVVVHVPSAGRLTASARGLTGASKSTKAAGTVTLKLKLRSSEVGFLKTHPGRKRVAKIRLQFTPQHGEKLSTSLTVLLR